MRRFRVRDQRLAPCIEPFEVSVLQPDGQIAAMKAYWGPENINQL